MIGFFFFIFNIKTIIVILGFLCWKFKVFIFFYKNFIKFVFVMVIGNVGNREFRIGVLVIYNKIVLKIFLW